MRNLLRLILPVALLIPFVLGCGAVQRAINEAGAPQDIVSTDGKTQVTVPGLWLKTPPVNPQISLQASYIPGEVHIAVVREEREGRLGKLTLDQYTDLLQKDMPRRMTKVDVGAPAALKVGGLEARQFEMAGTIQGHDFKYIFTVVYDNDNFYQVFAWTTPAQFDGNRAAMTAAIETFKPVGNGGGSSAAPAPDKTKNGGERKR